MIDVPSLRELLPRADQGYTIGAVGDDGTRLLSGPGPGEGSESLEDHLHRLGSLPDLDVPSDHRALVRESGLQGRGGGGFPVARKLETAWLSPGEPIIVVNASESEPASRKDRTLCTFRPHLVLDGAAAAAAMVESREVFVHMHRASTGARTAMVRAMADRRSAGIDDLTWRISLGPDRYVSGEASAIAAFIDGGEARPNFTGTPMAQQGPSGRPTVVNNAETMAHVGFLLRFGPRLWRSGGAPSSPGSHLLTLVGAVAAPGLVLELVGEATVGEVLSQAGEVAPPLAVLIGGYEGTWLEGDVAWQTPLERTALGCVGAAPGCGLIAVLPHGACGLAETARLVRYLAGETAGQCGPCVSGLPAMAELFEDLARGALRPRGLRRLLGLCGTVSRSGACGHPDGVVHLVRSAVDIFEDDVVRHLAGRACRSSNHPPVLAVPSGEETTGGWT